MKPIMDSSASKAEVCSSALLKRVIAGKRFHSAPNNLADDKHEFVRAAGRVGESQISNPVLSGIVQVNGMDKGRTAVLENIEGTAIQNLDEKYGPLIAKKVAGIVAKELVSDQIERHTKSPLLGFMAKVAFYASDQADVRSWNLLPRDLQIARIPVDPGVHEVRVIPDSALALPSKTVHVAAGKKAFVNFRYMP